MTAGRPRLADAGTLYSFAHQLYWDFRRLDEGGQRVWFDRARYEGLVRAIAPKDLIPTRRQRRAIEEVVEDAVRSGRAAEPERKTLVRDARQSQRFMKRLFLERAAHDAASARKRIPGEPDIIDELLQAETAERVREICQDAYTTQRVEVEPGVSREAEVPNWPIPYGSLLPIYLSQFAEAFVTAKQDARYPHSQRGSTRLKQLWFLSRALAGASFNVSTRTAINLVGSTRPEEAFENSRSARPRRKRARRPV